MNRQEKLEWLARSRHEWVKDYPFLGVSIDHNGVIYSWPSDRLSDLTFTRKEWLSTREELQNKPDTDNSWHERGELPPVGCKCMYVVSERLSYEVEITAHARFGLCFVEVGTTTEMYAIESAVKHRFSPLRTEREKAIDAAREAIGGVGDGELLVIGKLYDAGMLKQ